MKKDKVLHFLVFGSLCFIVGSGWGPVWGFAVSQLAGLAKEFIWDKWMKRGTFDWYDIWANVCGGVVACVALCVK